MTEKERIEYIKKRRKCAEKDGALSWVDIELDDFDWLIEHYEKFQEYKEITDIAEDRMVEIEYEYQKEITNWQLANEQWRINYHIKENLLNEAQELIKLLYNNMGGSADGDHALWMKTKEYCFKNKLITYEK